MARRTTRSRLLTASAAAALAVGLNVAPGWLTDRVRSVALDAARPGQIAVRRLAQRASSAAWPWPAATTVPADVGQLGRDLESEQLRCRRLEVANAMLREELERIKLNGVSPYPQTPGVPLFVTELVTASMVGRETADLWRAGCIIGAGTDDQIVDSALVVADQLAPIDQGRDAGVVAEQPVYAGHCVVGRIARAGRWLSLVQPLTDSDYRSELVQLARETPRGRVFGAQGILEGCGKPLCRLVQIDSTSSVRVGDDVYTGDGDARLPNPMYYGRVVKTELKPGARHWEVWVKPAVDIRELKTVQVLKSRINPIRALAE